MIDGLAIGLVLAGVILLFAGAALSVYGVVFLGVFLGGGGGYLLGPSIGVALGLEGLAAAGAPILLGAIGGGVLGYAVLSVTVALVSFAVGTLVGLSALAPLLVDGPWFVEWPVAIGIGLGAAFLGMFLTKWTMVAITSIVGAALASRTLTADQFAAAQEAMSLEPLLLEVSSPVFLALVTLGVLSQFGLFKFGYVAKLARILPGGKVLPGRLRRDESEPDPA